MTKQITEVRKSQRNSVKWVVDIVTNPFSRNGYVQPDGTQGPFYEYGSRKMARNAKALFRLADSVGVETSVGEKQTNPKDIIGIKKVALSTLPIPVLLEMALGMLEGARKYGRHNYRAMGVSATVYYDGTMRHLMDWFEGEDIDPDSMLNHITKALTCLTVLRDSMLKGNWIDDRPLRNPINMKELNKKAAAIIEKYPDGKAPYLENRFGGS